MAMGADELAGMLAFARVVEERSFSAAARRLVRSKSAVSKQVSELEDRLGVRLLNRTTRRLSLTEAGSAVYEHCLRMVAAAEEAERVVAALSGAVRGTLRLAAPVSFGTRHLAPLIPQLLQLYPELAIDLSLDDHMVDLVEEGFDLAVRIAELGDSGLIARRLATARRVLCAAPAYLAEHGVPREPRDLPRHNCLGYSYLRSPTGQEVSFRSEGGMTLRLRGNFIANNGEALLAALLGGVGIALMPTFIVADELRAGRLRVLLADAVTMDSTVSALYPANRNLSPKVRAVVDFLAERFGPTPPWDAGLP
jgi:DNA-binding transcriptional LysR family regulator